MRRIKLTNMKTKGYHSLSSLCTSPRLAPLIVQDILSGLKSSDPAMLHALFMDVTLPSVLLLIKLVANSIAGSPCSGGDADIRVLGNAAAC